jgi:hypothetical protein
MLNEFIDTINSLIPSFGTCPPFVAGVGSFDVTFDCGGRSALLPDADAELSVAVQGRENSQENDDFTKE